MATTATAFCNFRPSPVVCSAAQSNPNGKKLPASSSSSSSSSSKWWTPLFGISSDPDYIQSSGNTKKEQPVQFEGETAGRSRSKFSVGCFTEEKAKELRRKTIETSTFHDIMYHSAIASRLASDVYERWFFEVIISVSDFQMNLLLWIKIAKIINLSTINLG